VSDVYEGLGEYLPLGFRSAEFVAANGGKRERNPNGKYSPSEEMRLRSMKDK